MWVLLKAQISLDHFEVGSRTEDVTLAMTLECKVEILHKFNIVFSKSYKMRVKNIFINGGTVLDLITRLPCVVPTILSHT